MFYAKHILQYCSSLKSSHCQNLWTIFKQNFYILNQTKKKIKSTLVWLESLFGDALQYLDPEIFCIVRIAFY